MGSTGSPVMMPRPVSLYIASWIILSTLSPSPSEPPISLMWRFQYIVDATFSPSSQISENAFVCGTKSSAMMPVHSRTAAYSGESIGAGVVIVLRLMSPHPPIVVEPASMMVLMTVPSVFFITPCSWKAWRVVMRRSPWPYSMHSSSSFLKMGPGTSPPGTLRRSMNWYAFSWPLALGPFGRFSRSSCWYEPWNLSRLYASLLT